MEQEKTTVKKKRRQSDEPSNVSKTDLTKRECEVAAIDEAVILPFSRWMDRELANLEARFLDMQLPEGSDRRMFKRFLVSSL